jgi:hypothetical protein
MSNDSRQTWRSFITAFTVALTFAVAGIAIAADKVRTIPVPEGNEPAVARIDSDGAIHLVVNTPEGPRYSPSIDNGNTFSRPLAVVDENSILPGLQFTACDMAVDPHGNVHIVMSSNAWQLKRPKEEWAVLYARLDRGANAFTALKNINHTPSEGFSIAADANGNVTTCWLSGKLYLNTSRDYGKTFGPNIEIDLNCDPCDCCTTNCIYGADGRLAILYREETDNQRDMFLLLWDREANKVARTPVSTTLWKLDACPMTYFAVSRQQDSYVAVWPTRRQIYFARFNRQGMPQPPGEIATLGATGMRSGISALGDKEGNTLISWNQQGQLLWQLFNERGQPVGERGSAKTTGAGVAGVVSANNEFILFR